MRIYGCARFDGQTEKRKISAAAADIRGSSVIAATEAVARKRESDD